MLGKLNAVCGSEFKIVERDEMLSWTSPGDAEELGRLLGELKESGYIDVRYADGDVYCLRSLPEGKRYFEALSETRRDRGRQRRENFLLSFFGAFAGALLGAAIVLLLALWVAP